ncbi:MAG TPA: transporter [Sediminibacterium sp.]|nr:transporter [Sediminibacterium sp.]
MLIKKILPMLCLICCSAVGYSQTDIDAIMMSKNNFCTGFMYTHNSWDHYWEGTFKRDNQNLGTVSSQMIGVMGNYGLKDNLNLLFALPYISTKASMGTLAGQKGLQDLSFTVKWMPVEKKFGKGNFSLYALGTLSAPTTNYVADYLPLSIGMRSKSAMVRLMLDYQVKHFFVTGSAAYIFRDRVTIDRPSYYTTELHNTNKVDMPNMTNYNLRTGYRSGTWIAEAVLDIAHTQGGFDITKNNMPFLSNQMNVTRTGANVKYTFSSVEGLSLIGNAMFTLSGRNVGQTTSVGAGVFYIFDFKKKKK